MADDRENATHFSLRRWSQRKHAAVRGTTVARPDDAPSPGDANRAGATVARAERVGSVAGGSAAYASDARAAGLSAAATPSTENLAPTGGAPVPAEALPPVESLTIDSDFAPFLRPGVAEDLKRTALRKLFRDPRFNVMDGLDVYIDDYSKPSPLEPAIARSLMQARYIFDPPKTRVNAHGNVEDVPDEPVATDDPAAARIADENATPIAAAVAPDATVEPARDKGSERSDESK